MYQPTLETYLLHVLNACSNQNYNGSMWLNDAQLLASPNLGRQYD